MKKNYKLKLKRRGIDLYYKYFYNDKDVINDLVEQYDNGGIINDDNCKLIFNISEDYYDKLTDLITYFSVKLLNKRIVNNEYIDYLYEEYGETISILKETSVKNKLNVRAKLCRSARKRANKDNTIFNLNSDDIKLVNKCPYLDIPISYQQSEANDFSPSIDRINPNLGYVSDNIQVISFLANRMKNSASIEQLLIFSKNIIKLYDGSIPI